MGNFGIMIAQAPDAEPAPNEPMPVWSLDSIRDSITPEIAPFVAIGLGAIIALIVAAVLFSVARWLLKAIRKPKAIAVAPDLELDVANLPIADVASASPKLEIYGIRSVVVAVVVAPSGRDADEPPKRVAFHLLEAVTPGFGEVLAGHQPLLRIWPAQLSSQGFAQLFFSHARLPGDSGRGTSWTSAAGKVQWKGKSFLVGIVFHAEKPMELGQRVMDHGGLWVEMLRVRHEAMRQ